MSGKIIAAVLVLCIFLCGCSAATQTEPSVVATTEATEVTVVTELGITTEATEETTVPEVTEVTQEVTEDPTEAPLPPVQQKPVVDSTPVETTPVETQPTETQPPTTKPVPMPNPGIDLPDDTWD